MSIFSSNRNSLGKLIFLIPLIISFDHQPTTYHVGQKSVTYIDESRDRPLITEIWYPTLDQLQERQTSQGEKLPFVGIETVRDARIASGRFPLLLVSHGTGGNRFSLTWFIKRMVEEGYIVVSVDHYGNSSSLKIPREFVKWWERAIDIQFVLTQVLEDETIGPLVNRSKIGGVGFSLGGYTNIALAGGYVDRNRGGKLSELPPEFPKSDEIIDFEKDSLILASYHKYKDEVKDERLKAFFVMAPAIGFGFHTQEQTEQITAPIFIVAGKGDTNTPVEYNALKYHQLIATSDLYLFNDQVNHYVFLNEGTEFGKQILPELTIDHPEVDRRQIHDHTFEMALSFFEKELK